MRLTSPAPFVQALKLEGLTPDDLTPLQRVFEQMPELPSSLDSPLLTQEQKRWLIQPLELAPTVENAAVLMGELHLASRLYDLIEGLEDAYTREAGGEPGLLETAYRFSDETVVALARSAAEKIKKKFVTLKQVVTPELKGGFRISVAGLTYDYSLAGFVRDMSAWLREVDG